MSDSRGRLTQTEIMALRRRRMIAAGLPPDVAAMVVLLEQGRWNGDRMKECANSPHVSWKCSEPVGDLEGYVLTVFLRLVASGGKLTGKRNLEAPTMLTDHLVNQVAAHIAYLLDHISLRGLTTVGEVDAFVASQPSKRIESWSIANREKITAAHKRLGQLVGKFWCFG